MKLQIVETNLIFKHWSVKIWKHCFTLYALILLVFTIDEFDLIIDYKVYISTISKVFGYSSVLLVLIDSFLYKKRGILELNGHFLQAVNSKKDFEIDLNQTDTFDYNTVQNNIWKIQFNEKTIELKMSNEEYNQLMEVFSQYAISVRKKTFMEELKSWL